MSCTDTRGKRRAGLWFGAAFLGATLFAVGPAASAGFPPITDQQRQLKAVPGQPGATAVILFKDADFRFRDYPSEASSRLEVRIRIKILTEEGLSYGEVSIPHSRELRLDSFKGRTMTSSGQILEVPKDAIFQERSSRTEKSFVTKAAFPGVDVGSIIDYRYTFFWDDFYYLEPWLFHDDLPVLSSTITYFKPDNLGFQTWGRETGVQKMEANQKRTQGGLLIEVQMKSLQPLPNEPYSFPERDLASRFMIIPTAINVSGTTIPLLQSWEDLYKMAEEEYRSFIRKNKPLKEKARQLAADESTDRGKADAVYRWVRDELATVGYPRIWVHGERKVKEALEGRAATMTEKALILEAMLDSLGFEVDRLWIADRFLGRVDISVPNPTWMDGMILRLELDGESVHLAPSHKKMSFGALPTYYEDTLALVLNRKEVKAEITPPSASQLNLRHADLKLQIDEQGRAAGTGRLSLNGHPARFYYDWRETPEETVEVWQESLEGSFPGWTIGEVTVDEQVDEAQLTVTWTQEQREEEVLGDEVAFLPSLPLEASQPFTLAPDKRLTPVQMAYRKLDETTVEVSWPEGWSVDSTPDVAALKNEAGRLQVAVDVDEAERRLVYRRTFARERTEFVGDEYVWVRDLYEKATKSDAQELVWIED